jgi:hypothetical protein
MLSGRRASADEIGLAHRQWQAAQVFAVERQAVEGVELHFMIVLAGGSSDSGYIAV